MHRYESRSIYKFREFTVCGPNKTAVLKLIEKRKPAELFWVSETYSQVTPESAEHGDFSETGWTDRGSFMTLRELVKRIEDTLGYFESSGFDATSVDLYASDYHTVDYRTGTEEQSCLHIESSLRNMKRLEAVLKSKGGRS